MVENHCSTLHVVTNNIRDIDWELHQNELLHSSRVGGLLCHLRKNVGTKVEVVLSLSQAQLSKVAVICQAAVWMGLGHSSFPPLALWGAG